MKQYVVVFTPRCVDCWGMCNHKPRVMYGPKPRDWCERYLQDATAYGGPAGGSLSVREAEINVSFK